MSSLAAKTLPRSVLMKIPRLLHILPTLTARHRAGSDILGNNATIAEAVSTIPPTLTCCPVSLLECRCSYAFYCTRNKHLSRGFQGNALSCFPHVSIRKSEKPETFGLAAAWWIIRWLYRSILSASFRLSRLDGTILTRNFGLSAGLRGLFPLAVAKHLRPLRRHIRKFIASIF